MFINYLLLICALSLSTVAAYYSVVGLATIFAGAFWPVIIMGGLLEASKIIVSSWLYRRWKDIPLLLKTYLTSAVVILMIITSVGIFGFLSKAHIEQTGQIKENLAQVERFDAEIARQKNQIEKAEQRLKQLENVGTGSDVNVQNQISTEQQRIDDAYKRIQPAIDEQNRIIEAQTKIIIDQISDIDKQQDLLQRYIDSKEIAKAQGLVGTRADGDWGPGTAAAVKLWQQTKKQDKDLLLNKLEDINKNNGVVKNARDEIQRIRQRAEDQVAESNKLINRLREQLGKTKAEDVGFLITEQQDIIKKNNKEIDSFLDKKFQLESQYRKLEAEVGPIKYIANFIYNTDADKNILEKSVTWMIIVIILVFDPLAVLMIISANLGFMLNNSVRSTPSNSTPSRSVNEHDVSEINQSTIKKSIESSNLVSENQIDLDLTVESQTLQSNEPTITIKDEIEQNMPVEHNHATPIKLDPNEIIERISNGKTPMRYESRREWNGYKH